MIKGVDHLQNRVQAHLIYKIASKLTWIGIIAAKTEEEAIEIASKEFKVAPKPADCPADKVRQVVIADHNSASLSKGAAFGSPTCFQGHRRLPVANRSRPKRSGAVTNRPPSPLTMLLSRHTRRREFIAGSEARRLGSVVAHAQQPAERLRRIGVLTPLLERRMRASRS
jgi:hypothetical protein